MGIDHLTLSSVDLEAGVRYLQDLGFKAQFTERGLLNHKSKAAFLRCYQPYHHVSYLKASRDSIAVELVQHFPGFVPGPGKRALTPVFSGRCPGQVRNVTQEPVARLLPDCQANISGMEPVYFVRLEPFETEVYWASHPKEGQGVHSNIAGCVLSVQGLEADLGFWTEGLGFKLVGRSDQDGSPQWAILDFPAMVKSWRLKTALVERVPEDDNLPFLDDQGFTSVCLLSTNIRHDVDALSRFPGTHVGEIFPLQVSSRQLLVCVMRGPGGELIELIQVERSTNLEGA